MFLKDLVREFGPMQLTFVSRKGPVTKEKQSGSIYTVYEYTFRMSDGQEFVEHIWPTTHDFVLKNAQTDDVWEVDVSKKNPEWVDWRKIASAHPVANARNGEEAWKNQKKEQETKMGKRDICVCLLALIKPMMNRGVEFEKALKAAGEYRKILKEEVEKIYKEEASQD